MVCRLLVLFLVALATSRTQARRVKEEVIPSLRAPDNFKHADRNSTSKIVGYFTKSVNTIASKLSANDLVTQSQNSGGDALGKIAFGEDGGGSEGEDPEESYFAMMWKKLFGEVSAAAGEGGPARVVSARTGASTSKIAEYLTKPFKKMAKKLKDPASLPVTDLYGALHDISKKGGGLEQCGFAHAATQLLPNARQLSTCPKGSTIVQCLKHETVRFKIKSTKATDNLANILAHGKKPAILEDPSPAMGFIWSMRIFGFIGEVTEKVARGKSLVDAAKQAYVSRIAPAFTLWSPLGMVVKSAILAGLSEKNIMAMVGGEEAGMDKISENVRADMMEFSQAVLPLVDSIWDSIVAHKLDDSLIN